MNRKLFLIVGIVLLGIISLVSPFYIRENIVKAYKFPTASMEPTLLIGDHILVDRSKSARSPNRGDLIVFKFPEYPSKEFVKRVVAVAGDSVEIKDKTLQINGKVANEPYIEHKEKDIIPATQNPRDNLPLQKIPADSYFVLGDNRDRSYDSRFFGAVSKDKVNGTVKSIYWSWDNKNGAIRWDRIGKSVR